MPLIDKTYFIAEISLPASKYDDLDSYINRFEPDFLKRVLGLELYKLIKEEDSLVDDLVDGAEFEYNGELMEWEGFRNENKKSVIANYVYYFYLRNNVTFTTRMGEKKASTENSGDVCSGVKVMRAWDEMLNGIDVMQKYISTVPELSEKYKPTALGRVNAFDL